MNEAKNQPTAIMPHRPMAKRTPIRASGAMIPVTSKANSDIPAKMKNRDPRGVLNSVFNIFSPNPSRNGLGVI